MMRGARYAPDNGAIRHERNLTPFDPGRPRSRAYRGAGVWMALLVSLAAVPALAHELKSAALFLDEQAPGRISATLKTPVSRDGAPVTVVPRLSAGCTPRGDARVAREDAVIVRQWQLDCPVALADVSVRIEGLDPMTPDAVVVARFADGQRVTLGLNRHDPEVALRPSAQPRPALALAAYLGIGIEHILLGADHLLFVLGLMLVVAAGGGRARSLVAALTAFTLAHSLTLALAVLGVWGLPPGAVELLIAASIVLLAVELAAHPLRRQAGLPPSLTLRRPWLVAFAFGLLHGFGFAGALAQVGLPEEARGWALLLFNAGVEIGQLAFVAAVLAATALLRRLRVPDAALQPAHAVTAIGAVAAYWTLERAGAWIGTLSGSLA